MRRSARTLNEMPLRECYAFELRIIIENRREDGMHGSPQRRLAARNELAARASVGDEKAIAQLDILGCCPHGYPDQGDGCAACGNSPELRIAAAELLILETYNVLRISQRFDFGCGQRHAELMRRRRYLADRGASRELLNAVAEADTSAFTPAELAQAWANVGAPKLRRAKSEREKYGSTGVVRTLETWLRVERRFNRPDAPEREYGYGPRDGSSPSIVGFDSLIEASAKAERWFARKPANAWEATRDVTPLYSRPKSDPLAWRREGEVVALFDPDTLEVTTSVFYSQRDTTQDRGRLLTASERIRAARVMERS